MPLIAVRAATPYDRPGRKARQGPGLRVQEKLYPGLLAIS